MNKRAEAIVTLFKFTYNPTNFTAVCKLNTGARRVGEDFFGKILGDLSGCSRMSDLKPSMSAKVFPFER